MSCSLHCGTPLINRQVEAASKVILNGPQKNLDDAKGKWVDELLGVLWSIHTIEKTATGETPFILVCNSKVVLLMEVAIYTQRLTIHQEDLHNGALRDAIDLLASI